MPRGLIQALELLASYKMCYPELQWRLCVEKKINMSLKQLDGLIKTMLKLKFVELYDDPHKVLKDIVITKEGREMLQSENNNTGV